MLLTAEFKKIFQPLRPKVAQSACPGFDNFRSNLRHGSGRGSCSRRVGKYMKMGNPCCFNHINACLMRLIALGWESCNHISTKNYIRQRRRASLQVLKISLARWRRFIRFKITSSPCWADKCRCGKRRIFSSRTAINSASGSAGSIEDSLNRGRSFTSAKSWRTKLPRRGRPGKSLPHDVMSTPVRTNPLHPLATRFWWHQLAHWRASTDYSHGRME